jgi:spore maturation protein CgeB
MKIFMLWEFYPDYIKHREQQRPEMSRCDYRRHHELFMSDHYCWPADLAGYLKSVGHDAWFVVANHSLLQEKWAKQNDYSLADAPLRLRRIAMTQISRFRPDVLWLSFLPHYFGSFIKEALSYAKKVVVWVGSPFVRSIDTSGISALLTENPRTLHHLHSRFERVIVTKPAFSAEVLQKIDGTEKDLALTFSGQIAWTHKTRTHHLAYLAGNGLPLKCFSMLPEHTAPRSSSTLRDCAWALTHRRTQWACRSLAAYLGTSSFARDVEVLRHHTERAVYGLEMYEILARSQVTTNTHIDVAGNNAGNMRLVEATGVGTCLLTEASDNIAEMFEPDSEVVTYNSKEELLEKTTYLLGHREDAVRIGLAGQRRTLKQHTMARVWEDIMPAFAIQVFRR